VFDSYTLLAYGLFMIFIELPVFTRVAAGLFDDEALRRIQEILLADPEAGDVIPGGGGLRKLRAPLPGRGKRGGARVIYYWWVRSSTVTSSTPTPRMNNRTSPANNSGSWRAL
jgi:hypothetical protein